MKGDVFRFKSFDVFQGKCTMRVNTDGVLLGAWTNAGMKFNVLDIGTGTGLIALMIASKNPEAQITAIDIDENAVDVALFNASNIRFGNRIQVVHASLQQFCTNKNEKFDLIVSNPPYFNAGTKPKNKLKMSVRHTSDLTYEILIQCVCELLLENGSFNLILPFAESVHFKKLALNAGMYLNKATKVYSKKDRPVERMLMSFSFRSSITIEDNLIIHNTENPVLYSEDYINLTKDYYLFM